MNLRDWLASKPYDGDEGHRASIAVEAHCDGALGDTLCLFDGERCVVGFSGTAENNAKLADAWCAKQLKGAPEPMPVKPGFFSGSR